MTKHLTDLSERLAKLVDQYPEGVPVELVDIERRRVAELAYMVAEGLTDP